MSQLTREYALHYVIDEIKKEDDRAISAIIKKVGAEYGAIGDGFGPSDAEVSCMSEHYRQSSKSRYFIARVDGRVVGGCGIAAFNGSDEVCELRKLFLVPDSRGQGLGRKLVLRCLEFADSQGFKSCYLDTLESMTSAIALYETLGFRHLKEPLLGTEHNGCDVWMLLDLE